MHVYRKETEKSKENQTGATKEEIGRVREKGGEKKEEEKERRDC